MLPILHINAPAAAASLVAAAWQGAALALLVALALRLLPNLSATVRSAIWTAVLALVVLLPFAHAFSVDAPVAHREAPFHVAAIWSFALVAVWAAFSLLRAGQLVASAIHLRRLSRRAIPIDTTPELAPLLRAGRRSAQLCLSSEVDRPSVAGFFTPRILLPATLLAKLSTTELEQIVLHEMEHLKRHDDWINLAQKLALAIFPLNPALLFVERRLCLERELACDDGVLRATTATRSNARKAYATCLANLAEHSLVRRSASLALAAWSRRSELATRVHRILFRPATPMPRRQTAMATSLIAFVLLGGAATLAHAPQLVSFTPTAEPTLADAAQQPLTAPALVDTIAHTTSYTYQAPHATLVSAILPGSSPKPRHATHRKAITPLNRAAAAQPAPFRAVETLASADEQQQQPAAEATETVVVLTRWEYIPTPAQTPSSDANPPQQTPTSQRALDRHSAPTYAAVATPGGWIIFLL
jgi:beta-lactamase regulating signal transducer with metallopeptidase domain